MLQNIKENLLRFRKTFYTLGSLLFFCILMAINNDLLFNWLSMIYAFFTLYMIIWGGLMMKKKKKDVVKDGKKAITGDKKVDDVKPAVSSVDNKLNLEEYSESGELDKCEADSINRASVCKDKRSIEEIVSDIKKVKLELSALREELLESI